MNNLFQMGLDIGSTTVKLVMMQNKKSFTNSTGAIIQTLAASWLGFSPR